MSKLSTIKTKGEKVQLGEVEIEIKPLTVSSLPLMMELGKEGSDAQGETIREIISKTLKDAVPDATEDEIDKLPIEHIATLMEAIMKVNKMEDMQNKEFIEHVKRAQSTGDK